MKTATLVLLSVSALSVFSASDGETPAPLVPAELFDSSSSAPPHTSTGPPHTSTGPPHTSTGPPHTSTAHTNATTGPPLTTHRPLKTTTRAANATTRPSPPQPTPHTSVTPGDYNVTDERRGVCLRAHMALQIRLARDKATGVFIVQPNLTSAEGSCVGTTANLSLTFREGHVTFLFNKSSTDGTVYVSALSLSLLYPLDEKGGSDRYSANNESLHLFAAKTGHSYACTAESVSLGGGLYLDVSQDRVQAFNLSRTHDFGTPDVCPADRRDHRVAIGVGVALLVLIVIVVVAYLLSRRRRTGGYQLL